MAAATFMYVDRPVASLQFDITVEGVLAAGDCVAAGSAVQAGKTASMNPTNGRVLIFGLNTNTFTGFFLECTKRVTSVSNIVASDPNADPIQLIVGKVTKGKNLHFKSK